jgi:hypothetical protein
MAAKSCRPAGLDGTHHFKLAKAHMAAVGLAPCSPMVAEDIRDLQRWTGHGSRLYRRFTPLGPQRRQPVERAHDVADDVGCHLRIACRRIEI